MKWTLALIVAMPILGFCAGRWRNQILAVHADVAAKWAKVETSLKSFDDEAHGFAGAEGRGFTI